MARARAPCEVIKNLHTRTIQCSLKQNNEGSYITPSIHRITFHIVRNYVINITKRIIARLRFRMNGISLSLAPGPSTFSDKLTGTRLFTVKKIAIDVSGRIIAENCPAFFHEALCKSQA